LDNARKDLMNTHKSDHGRLRISAPTWFCQQVLPPILSAFRELYPKISFDISLADGLVNIIDDDYDLAPDRELVRGGCGNADRQI
ncbi:LysR substrate-binding domain-containing protein, partial [Rhizobium johnstonii]